MTTTSTPCRSSSQHTPGPWTVQWGRDGDTYPLGIHCFSANIVTAVARPASAEARANARLIAAAPALLEALRDLAESNEACGIRGAYLDAAKRVIASATTGETP